LCHRRETVPRSIGPKIGLDAQDTAELLGHRERVTREMVVADCDYVGAGYGIAATTFNQCVTYQESRNAGQSVPPYRMDQYNNRVDAEGYRVDSTGRRMPVQNQYYSLPGQASSSQVILRDEQVILRDEYGNRYDSRGNRI
jgi:hypothetical protein